MMLVYNIYAMLGICIILLGYSLWCCSLCASFCDVCENSVILHLNEFNL